MAAHKLCSNLIPVGKECTFASETEARYFFAQQGLLGNVSLVLVSNETSDDEDDDIYAWLLTNDNGEILGIISLFETTIKKLSKITFYEKIARGEIFKYKRTSYQVVWNKLLGLTIREISDFHHQSDIENVLHQIGYKRFTFYLCKLFPVIGPQKLITYCWKVYTEDDEEGVENIFYFHLSQSDAKKTCQWEFNDINTIAVDIGETINFQGQTWRLFEDENGKLFVKPFTLNFIKKASQ